MFLGNNPQQFGTWYLLVVQRTESSPYVSEDGDSQLLETSKTNRTEEHYTF